MGCTGWTGRHGWTSRTREKRARRGWTVLLLAGAVALVAAAPAGAATVSGVVKNGTGYQVVAVQANGTAKKATVSQSSGSFTIRGVKLASASLQLVRADGSYFGPIVLKASGTRAYEFVKGSGNLKIGTVLLKSGYALVVRMPFARFQTAATVTARAVRGKPIGAGKLGRVATGQPKGCRGPAGDLDLDGVINAFDIDDNGNLILDNVDRSSRGAGRPVAQLAPASSSLPTVAAPRDDPSPSPSPQPSPPGPQPTPPPTPPGPVPTPPPTPPGPVPTAEFRMFSNFKLGGANSINVNIPGIGDIDALIARDVPRTVTLATQVIGGKTATLDGLGNVYFAPHSIDGVSYPQVNFSPPTYTGNLLNLVVGDTHDAQIKPGALPDQIGAGDSFLQTAADGKSYPGTLNFVFNTAPALKSYRFDTDASVTPIVYDEYGAAVSGMSREAVIGVPHGATAVTFTFWRPQRKASPGEAGNAGGWIDIGGLQYRIDLPNAVRDPQTGAALPGTHSSWGAYSDASANGVPVATTPNDEGVNDPAADAPSNPAGTITFTLSLTKSFSDWRSFGPGTEIRLDIEAVSQYGDNAAQGLRLVLQ
jgi:hypothetical protein